MHGVSRCLEMPRDPAWAGVADARADLRGLPAAVPAPAVPARFSGLDVRAMSPRAMAELSLELYLDGLLRYDEYALLAFQPELHPRFDATIGALSGERADPDRPRDHVQAWRDRLDFERRHGDGDESRLRLIHRILGVLGAIDGHLRDCA